MESKRIEISRGTATNLPILAERDWRLSVREDDNSIVPNNSPKSKPLIGATWELLLLTFASRGANQSEAYFLDENWMKGIAITLYHTKPPNTSYFS